MKAMQLLHDGDFLQERGAGKERATEGCRLEHRERNVEWQHV